MFRDYKPDREGIFLPHIEIKEHPEKGYICVATTDIDAGTLIERCPTVKFAAGTSKFLVDLVEGRTILHDYFFCRSQKGFAFWCMGYGGIYSHSNEPNARWTLTDHPNGRTTVDIRATKKIKKGEEITHAYVRLGYKVQGEEKLWFDPATNDVEE